MSAVVTKEGSFYFAHSNKGSVMKKKATWGDAVFTGAVVLYGIKAKGPTLLLTQSLTNPLNSASKLQ